MQLSTNCEYSTIFKQLPTITSGINQLGEATNKLKAINFSVVGLNTGNIDAYRNAISGISKEQATLLLSIQGLNQAQIDLVLSNEKVTATEIAEASVLDNIAKKKSILTAEQQKQLISSNAITSEKLAEISATLGLETAENGSLVSKKALNAEMVKQQLQSIGIVGSTQTQIMSMLGLTTAETSAATASNVLSGAMTKLSLAMSTNPIGALITVIGIAIASVYGLTKAFDALTDSAEEIDERVDSLISKYNDLKTTADNKASTIESLADEYESLSKGVNDLGENISLTSDEYDRYNEIVNQIADIFPTLITGYTDEGTAILSLKGNVEQLRDTYKEAQQKAYNLLVATGKDSDGNDIMESYKNLSELDWWDSSIGAEDVTTTTKRDITKQILILMSNMDTAVDEYDKLAQYIFDTYGDKGYNFLEEMGLPAIKDVFSDTSGITKEALIVGKATVQSYYQGFQSEIDTKLSNVKLMANAFLNTNDFYLDESTSSELKNALSVIVNSLDEELANSFNGEKEKVGAYVNNIVNGIKDNEDAKKALTELFTLDTTGMPVNDIQRNVNSYISTIATTIREDSVELKVRLGFDDTDTQPLIENVKKKLKGTEFDDKVGELSLGDLKIAADLEVGDDTIQSWDDLIACIEKVKSETFNNDLSISFSYGKLEDIPQKFTEVENAYKTAQDALDSYNENGYYSMDVIDSILSLEDDYINILIDENGQLQINSESMNQLATIKIEAAKASIYQETCEELVRIKTLDTSLAAQELALVNGTLTESAYETAKALYEEVIAMGGANATLAGNVWDAATKKVKLLDNQLKSLSSGTYTIGKSSLSESATKAAEDTTEKAKEYIESYMKLQEKSLEAGKIDYKTYCNTVSNLLKSMYKDGKISAQDYHDYMGEMLETQLSIYNKVINAVTRRFDTEIDKINETIDGIEKQNDTLQNQLDNYDSILSVIDSVYETEIDRIKSEQDAIQATIDALQDENDERELALKLEEARWALYKAQSQRTQKIFNGTEFVYETDRDAIRDAQENLADLELEQVVDRLEKEKAALDDTISGLEKYRDLWAEISYAYKNETNEQLIIALYGKNYQEIILRNQLSDIEDFKNHYVSIQDQINDNEGLISSFEEKIEYYEALKQQWSDISDAYEQAQENQYAAMILGQNWEAEVLSGRIDTLNDFKNQYIAIQQAMADATIAANNAIVTSNEAAKHSQLSSGVSVGSSDLSGGSGNDNKHTQEYKVVYEGTAKTVKTFDNLADAQTYVNAMNVSRAGEDDYMYYIKKYASGTTNAKKGLSLVSEKGDEIIIQNGGSAVVAQGEQLYPFEGGETVIKASETKKILSNMKNAASPDNSAALSKIMNLPPTFSEEEFRQRVMSCMSSYSSMVQIPNMQTSNFEPANRDNSVKVEIGDIHLHEVQKADALASEIIRELPNKVIQRLGRK